LTKFASFRKPKAAIASVKVVNDPAKCSIASWVVSITQ